eukprot:366213-Chlamydomonas_euryale.AAC.5
MPLPMWKCGQRGRLPDCVLTTTGTGMTWLFAGLDPATGLWVSAVASGPQVVGLARRNKRHGARLDRSLHYKAQPTPVGSS